MFSYNVVIYINIDMFIDKVDQSIFQCYLVDKNAGCVSF